MQGVADLFDVSDSRKRALLQALGLLHSSGRLEALKTLDGLLQSARVHCLSTIELYFLHDAAQLKQPLNLRNEAAVVSLLLAALAEPAGQAAAGSAGDASSLLQQLSQYSETLWPELASGDVALSGSTSGSSDGSAQGHPPRGVPAPAGSAAADFEAWAREKGVQAGITIASFGALRGCAATRDIRPGETALSIPESVLIYEDTVRQTDLGRMLMAIPNLTIDNLLIIFTMIDRHDEDSQWARYWRSLPDKYYTGLSFQEELVQQLAGTAAHLELTRAQAHLRQQYADTRPLFDMLLQAYPQFLRPEWFDYESYLWAAELWYSYAFEIEFPKAPAGHGSSQEADGEAAMAEEGTAERGASRGGSSSGKPAAHKSRSAAGGGGGGGVKAAKARRRQGGSSGGGGNSAGGAAQSSADGSSASSSGGGSSKPVMVPFACHINHSPWPHCVRYGRVNPRTRTLDYPAFRPCPEGQQVFISYGPVPNLKLLCYYGFVVAGNPHDVVPLQLEIPDGPLRQQQEAALVALGITVEHSLQDGPLSMQLLACLRVIVATAPELQLIKKKKVRPLAGPINAENEEQAVGTLRAALEGMLRPLEALPLLAQQARQGHAAAEVTTEGAAEQQLHALHLDHHQQQQTGVLRQEEAAAAAGRADGQPATGGACNENGFDADWRMSRHFCRVYLEGQRTILRRSLQECDALVSAAAAAAVSTPSGAVPSSLCLRLSRCNRIS
ncbi:hypothetical protein ABPG75_000727 [Micractinium tetrahymenae]